MCSMPTSATTGEVGRRPEPERLGMFNPALTSHQQSGLALLRMLEEEPRCMRVELNGGEIYV